MEPARELGSEVRPDAPPRSRTTRRIPPVRAGLRKSILFALVPPAAGVALGGLLLRRPEHVPWILVGSVLAGLAAFLLVAPLGRRSRDFQNALYRRGTELAVLAGLTAGALVVYTLVVYVMLGYRRPWLLHAMLAVTGGEAPVSGC